MLMMMIHYHYWGINEHIPIGKPIFWFLLIENENFWKFRIDSIKLAKQ
jgi:hypothetical protein